MILNSPTISGSLTVTGNIITSGSITISGSIASASYATNAELLDGLDSTVFTLTSSFNTTSASLYTVSSSAYVTSGSLSATSGSLSAASGSLSATSGSLSAASGSFNTRVSALEATGSALSSSLLTVSGSGYATSASLSAASGSFDSRVATIESKYATTGSNTFIGTQVVSGSILQSGSFTSTGTLTAQTLVVQTVTSSVVYSSGSNVFGNSLGNSQVFTGSVLITGSLTIAGGSSATSYSGTTIYGSTAVCSAVGKFTTCIDAGTGTFSGAVAITTALGLLVQASSEATIRLNNTGGGTEWRLNSYTNGNLYFQSAAGATNAVNFTPAGAATFSSTITGTTIYGSTAVCSPVGKFSTCLDLGGALTGTSGTFSGILSSSGGDIRSTGTAADSVTAGPFISVRNASNSYQYLLQLNATYGLDFWTYGGTWNKRMTLDASGRLIVGSGITANGASIQTSGDIRADYSSAIYLQINGGADGDYRKGFSGINQETGVARGLHIFNYDPDSSQGIKFYGGTFAAKVRFGGFDSGGNFFVNATDSAAGYKFYVNGTVGITGAATFSSSVTATKIITTGGNGAEIFNASTATTGSNYFNIRNTGAILFFGIENSTGGSLQTGASAYASILTTGNATDLSLGTGQVERMVIKATTGNVGIGTSTPSQLLDIVGTTPMINIQAGANTNARGIQFNYNGATVIGSLINFGATGENALSAGSTGTSGYFITLKTDGTERMRITSTGIACFACQVCAPRLNLNRCTTTAVLTINNEDSTDDAGIRGLAIITDRLRFGVSPTTSTYGTIATNGTNSGITFVTYDNAWTEKMRIACNGDLTIKGSNHCIYTNSGATISFDINVTRGRFYQALIVDGTVCAPCFATISDYRMKSNIRPIEGLSIIMNTKPYKFEYNYDCSTSFGMIAHELQDTLPEAVFGQKDGEVMQGVDYMKLLPITIKAIQEQQCTINILKTCLGIS